VLLEYDLADFILVQSTYAAETFVAAGIPAGKIIIVARGRMWKNSHRRPRRRRFFGRYLPGR
jgi:hypothetical protein